MKSHITIFTLYFFAQIISAQRLSSFSIAPLIEGNTMTVDGFGKLNEVLKKNNLYTIQSGFTSRGVALKFTRKSNKSGVELSYLNVFSYLYDSTSSTNRMKRPFISGGNFRISFFKKLFESSRWYADASLGISTILLNFKLVDLDYQGNSLDSLISNPKLSPTIDVSQSKVTVSLEVSSGIYFKTKWFKKAFDDFDIGAKFGYVQPISNGGQWRVNGTVNNFLKQDLPVIGLNNVYFQLSFLLKYNFKNIKTD